MAQPDLLRLAGRGGRNTHPAVLFPWLCPSYDPGSGLMPLVKGPAMPTRKRRCLLDRGACRAGAGAVAFKGGDVGAS